MKEYSWDGENTQGKVTMNLEDPPLRANNQGIYSFFSNFGKEGGLYSINKTYKLLL